MIRFDDRLALARIARASGYPTMTTDVICISTYDEDGALAGGMIFDQFNGRTVMSHIAGFHEHWARPSWLFAVSDFAFNHLKAEKVAGIIMTGNTQAVDFALKAGFRVENILKDFYPTGDAYFVAMNREDCPFLSDRFRRYYDKERERLAARRVA